MVNHSEEEKPKLHDFKVKAGYDMKYCSLPNIFCTDTFNFCWVISCGNSSGIFHLFVKSLDTNFGVSHIKENPREDQNLGTPQLHNLMIFF